MLLVSAVLVGTGSAACSSHTPAPGAAQTAVPVTTVTVGETDLAQSFEAGGAVRARTVATVVSRLMADVRTVLVKPGDRVRQGQPLIQLDARELQAQRSRAEAGHVATQQSAELAAADYQAAEAGLTLARVTHQRVSDLRTKGSATQSELTRPSPPCAAPKRASRSPKPARPKRPQRSIRRQPAPPWPRSLPPTRP